MSGPAAAAPDPPYRRLSVMCRLYGDHPHKPCSGTRDDGSGGPCEHWCHREQIIESTESLATIMPAADAQMLARAALEAWEAWEDPTPEGK